MKIPKQNCQKQSWSIKIGSSLLPFLSPYPPSAHQGPAFTRKLKESLLV
jgi:hypothetical protein